MKRLFQIMILVMVLMLVSCGGKGKSSGNSCPDGYDWSGTDCVKTDTPDSGDSTVTDTDPQPDGGDTADDTDPEDTDADTEPDDGGSNYTGTCKKIGYGASYEINIETKKLTIGEITVKGAAGDEALYGELWGENSDTLSEFLIGEITPELSGKTLDLPKGKYNFAYRPVSSANKINLKEDVEITADKTIDFDLPLYHLKGKVLNNSGSDFTVEETYQAETKLILKAGGFEKEIPYSEFSGYDVLLPQGSYTVYFKGQLAAGQGFFEGTAAVKKAAEGQEIDEAVKALEIGGESAEIAKNITIKTITFTGSITKPGYAVSAGRLVLVENPPLGSINGVVVADLSAASSYSITVTAGADLYLLYLPSEDSYPQKYIMIETWNDKTATPSSHDISLDFGRVYGKITFRGGKTFPTVTNCTGLDCTIGKLKASGTIDLSSYLVKDLGAELSTDEEGNVTYEALLVRRLASVNQNNDVIYSEKTYKMSFESFLNDAEGVFKSLPFTVEAKGDVFIGTYEKVDTEGNVSTEQQTEKTSSFSFTTTNTTFERDESNNIVADESGTPKTKTVKTWLTEQNIDFDVAPVKVSGKVTLNGSTFSTDKDDMIRLKDEDGMEYAVINLSELSGGEYSFYAPAGTYSAIYDGEGILSRNFKTYIYRGLEAASDTEHDLEIKTGKITLDFNVNGTPFAEWVDAQENLESYGLAINIDKTASEFVLDFSKKEGKYAAEVITGSTVNAYLELAFKDKVASEKSYSRIRLLASHDLKSGTTVRNDISLVGFNVSVKLNGKAVAASDYAAKYSLFGVNSSEIYCPAEGSAAAVVKEGEYKKPAPELLLNEGFGMTQEIALDCVYFGK